MRCGARAVKALKASSSCHTERVQDLFRNGRAENEYPITPDADLNCD
jgi:hypothetical protein